MDTHVDNRRPHGQWGAPRVCSPTCRARAIECLPLTLVERRGLRLYQLTPAADELVLPHRHLAIPEHHCAVLAAHRDMRLADGSPLTARLLTPQDDNTHKWT